MHKFYMSVTHIKYVPKQKALQITMRVFIDDLQLEINDKNNTQIELATDREPKKVDSIYANYISTHFTLEVNLRPKNITFLGKEYDDDMVVFYLEIQKIQEIHQMKLENSVLVHSFSEQENIVKLDINQREKTLILTKNNSNSLLNY